MVVVVVVVVVVMVVMVVVVVVVVMVVVLFHKLHNVWQKQKLVSPDKMMDTVKSVSKSVW